MRNPKPLRTLLYSWLIFAIVIAVASSALVVGSARPEAVSGVETIARTISEHLASVWDDPKVTEAYVEDVRAVTGFDLRLFRHPRALPPRVARAAERNQVIVADGPDHILVPVAQGGKLVGALQMDRFGVRPRIIDWWRVAAALAVALALLGLIAGRISNQLAAPLERLAGTADRFGGGDLAHRADVANPTQRWVTREAHAVALAFNKMADRVEATVRGQRELLGAISHELRSPLGRARVALEIARDRMESGDGTTAARPLAGPLDTIEKELGEVDAILGDLLAATRAGLADLRKESVELVPWLRARIDAEPEAAPVVLDADVESGLRVPVDSALLGRALHNLLANARAHGHPQAEPLTLALRRDGGKVTILVRDRGPGFAPELLPRAFDPFVRGEASRARPAGSGEGRGTGLGLALVRRIAEAHGGTAFARNVEGGAEVGVELPAEDS
jgi:signal transduction histidine kinase